MALRLSAIWVWAATTLWPCMTATLNFASVVVCASLVEEVKRLVVVFIHDAHVFLVEVSTGEAAELVILGLVVRIETGGRSEAPGLGKGLHLVAESGMIDDHLVGEGFDLGIGGLGLG